MSQFTPISALVGGVLIGASASLALLYHGKIAGISGIVDGALEAPRKNLDWRVPFIVGLIAAGFVASFFVPQAFGAPVRGILPLAIAGVLVGFGTRLGNGCTSGHGISGLSRLSPRSLVATLTFIGAGVVTTYLVHHFGGGA